MKTIQKVLEDCKVGDVLTAGKLRWKVATTDFDGVVVAVPDNKATKFELWNEGLESVACIEGLVREEVE